MTNAQYIFLLDDDQGLIDSATSSFTLGAGFKLEAKQLTRINGEQLLEETLTKLRTQSKSILLIDWMPLKANLDMVAKLRDLDLDKKQQVILTSWLLEDDFAKEVKYWGLSNLRRLSKPFTWSSISFPQAPSPSLGEKTPQWNRLKHRRMLVRTADGEYTETSAINKNISHWPVPEFSSDEIDKLQQGREIVVPLRGWLPWDPKKFDWFQLVTVPHSVSRNNEYPDRLSQYAIPRPSDWASPEPDNAVEDIFRLMDKLGFYRGRYYEIDELPDEQGTLVLQLIKINHPLHSSLGGNEQNPLLPISRKLDGILLERAKELISSISKNNNINDLIYTPRPRRDDENMPLGDLGVTFWNELVDIDGLSAWLELPIYRRPKAGVSKQDRRNTDGLGRLLGWMIFDRKHNPSKDQQGEIRDTPLTDSADEIEEIKMRVKAIELPLLESLEMVRDQKQDREQHGSALQSESRKILRRLLAAAESREERERSLLVAAGDAGELSIVGTNESESSVLFARYSAATKSLVVTEDTSQKLLGQEFPILSKFALARCAAKKKLVVVPDWDGLANEEKIQKTDWLNLPGMTESRAEELFTWARMNILTTVALPVLSKGNALLGVLVERHLHRYHFSRERIQNLEALVDTARPYLELDANRDSSDVWDGAIMHEIRAGVASPYRDLNALIDHELQPDALRPLLKSTLYAIEDLRDLSNMFLETIGKQDKRTRIFQYERNISDDGHWLASLKNYAASRATPWGDLKLCNVTHPWNDSNPPPCVTAPDRLIRVVRILLDNAFKYGDIGKEITLVFKEAGKDAVDITVSNGGKFSDAVINFDFRAGHERLDLGGRSLRVHLGLTLAKALIEEQGMSLALRNVKPNGLTLAEANFHWPVQQNCISDKSIEGNNK